MVPTYPRPRSVADLAADPIGPNSELGVYTNFVNLMDLCALAAPTALRSDGFPNGVTLIAPAGRDELIASFGALLQNACGGALGATGRKAPALRLRVSIVRKRARSKSPWSARICRAWRSTAN